DRKIAAARVAHHTGRERGEVLEVAPVDRQVVNRALIDRRGDRGAPSFDDCGFARHEHITRVYAGHLEAEVKGSFTADRHNDVICRLRLETLRARSADSVSAGRQEDEPIVTFCIGRCGLFKTCILILGCHSDVLHGRALRVEHAPFNVAGCGLRLGEGESGSKEQGDTQREQTNAQGGKFVSHVVLSLTGLWCYLAPTSEHRMNVFRITCEKPFDERLWRRKYSRRTARGQAKERRGRSPAVHRPASSTFRGSKLTFCRSAFTCERSNFTLQRVNIKLPKLNFYPFDPKS